MTDRRAGREPKGAERRLSHRYEVRDLQIDLRSGETFLFAYVENISEMGIFVASREPLPVGTRFTLRFPARDGRPELVLEGSVRWVNPPRPGGTNPGMGIAFEGLGRAEREQVVELVRAVAYLTRP